VKRINAPNVMSMHTVKMENASVMVVIMGKEFEENVSVLERPIRDSVFLIRVNMVDRVSKSLMVIGASALLVTKEKTVSSPSEQLRLHIKHQTLAQVRRVRMEGAAFQKEPNSSVCAPKDSKDRHARQQRSHTAILTHVCMAENVSTAKMVTLVHASVLTGDLTVKWMTVTSAIYTPYVYKERVDVELATKAMVSSAKR